MAGGRSCHAGNLSFVARDRPASAAGSGCEPGEDCSDKLCCLFMSAASNSAGSMRAHQTKRRCLGRTTLPIGIGYLLNPARSDGNTIFMSPVRETKAAASNFVPHYRTRRISTPPLSPAPRAICLSRYMVPSCIKTRHGIAPLNAHTGICSNRNECKRLTRAGRAGQPGLRRKMDYRFMLLLIKALNVAS